MPTTSLQLARQLLSIALIAWLAAASPKVAHAQDAKAQAEALNAEGRKLVTQLDLEDAAERFRQAMQLEPDPRYAFNLCYTLEKSRKFIEAWQACTKVEGAADQRLAGKAAKLLTQIEKQIAREQSERAQSPNGQNAQRNPQPIQPPIQSWAPPAAASARQPAMPVPYQRRETYGWHVFFADAASFTAVAVGAGNDSPELSALGATGLLLGGTAVHALHGNSRAAWISVGTRIALPLTGMLLVAGSCSESECGDALITGSILGVAGALIFDWAWLAEKTELVYPQEHALVQPILNITKDSAVAGLRLQL